METTSPNGPRAPSQMKLYASGSERLYINAAERQRFLEAAERQPDHIRAFCLTLLFTGCRFSEARELRFAAVQPEARLISIRSLKKRSAHHIREIPVPPDLVEALDRLPRTQTGLIWEAGQGRVNRIRAHRWIKAVMSEAAISGPQATPKGLRHGYGIHAVRSGVQLHMLQKWMGHASMKTTAIYASAIGAEELEIADRMWT